jgi:hypothetical protein
MGKPLDVKKKLDNFNFSCSDVDFPRVFTGYEGTRLFPKKLQYKTLRLMREL